MNREAESGAMRPLARALTKSLEKVRGLLRDASLCSDQTPPCFRNLISSLCTFDHLLAEFELRYVSAMVPVKTAHEYELQQLVVVLFSETLQRALIKGLLTQEMIDDYDPALMFTIPRLAIVSGLLFYPYMSPLSLDQNPTNMSDMFRPFRSLLMKIRELLLTLSKKELSTLEKMLCSSDEVKSDEKLPVKNQQLSSQETSDEDSECLSSSTAELVMNCNNVSVNTTIEHCSTKGRFPSSSPQDLINNNDSSTKHHKSFGSSIISPNGNNLQNNELKIPVSPVADSTASDNNECSLESGSVPDADLTECLATATEALTEILVKTNVIVELQDSCMVDTNGNETLPLPPRQHPNVSSSSTQTECPPPLSSCHSCCCTEWNCWKPLQSATDDANLELCSSSSSSSSSNGSSTVISIQCQSATGSHCCSHHMHRRKKVSNATSNCCCEPIKEKKINNCECGNISSTKYSKNWRELRKASNNNGKRPSSAICRFQSCKNRNNPKPMIKKHETCSSCSSCTTSSADESDDSVSGSTSTDSSSSYTLRRQKARAKFRSDEDLLHRLFVCISGVADQLQTNFAGDLRNILKAVFLMSNSNSGAVDEQQNTEVITGIQNSTALMIENGEEALVWRGEPMIGDMLSTTTETPPPWVPDNEAPVCMSCKAMFTVVRRRHHCRNCGKVFCSRCSSNSVPLPRFGHLKPVRVCNRCFIYQVTPFTLEPSIGPVPIVMQS